MPIREDMERTVEDVADCLRNAKERQQPCSFLVGAGCSVSAGIPTALGLVEQVRDRYPAAYARAREKTYPNVMAELGVGSRYDFIATITERSTVNWAHVQLAWLMANGYVGRILTTNFDNLVLRACSLFGLHPAVYDLAAAPRFSPSLICDPAVFYLHGQYRGFIQLHRTDEVRQNARRLRPAFEDATVRRPWIVVGYSGENDPVFENLANIPKFIFDLFWVTYDHQDPSAEVANRLLTPGRQAYLVRAKNSDRFFIDLCRALGMEAPPFVTDPFRHAMTMLEKLSPFPADAFGGETDITRRARLWLEQARAQYVTTAVGTSTKRHMERLEAQLMKNRVEGNDQAASALVPKAGLPDDSSLNEEFASAIVREAAAKLYSANTQANGADRGSFDLFYDVAAAFAARGDVINSLIWLRRRMAVHPLLEADVLDMDPDFAGIKNHPEFQEIVATIKEQRIGKSSSTELQPA